MVLEYLSLYTYCEGYPDEFALELFNEAGLIVERYIKE